MTSETDFGFCPTTYAPMTWKAINSVNPVDQKTALRQIYRDHPEVDTIHMVCWYEGTLPQAVEPVTPLVIRRR